MRFLKSVMCAEFKATVFTFKPLIAVEMATAFLCLAFVNLRFGFFISFFLQLQTRAALPKVRMPTPSDVWVLSSITLQSHLANRTYKYPDVVCILGGTFVV